MNDSINIKIGAEDAGFENTLKTVQDELKSLEGKVNSGDLSFKELERTMKKIGQVEDMEKRLKAMGGESSASSDKVGKLGSEIINTGNKSDKGGEMISASFAKIAGAVAVGQAAFEAFKATVTMGISAVTGVIGGIANSFTSAIDAAAEMETLKTAFIPLLGSADAAQKRIEDLARFAAETPFEMPEIAKASKTLETLTRGALSTSEGLRLVGDVASATNAPFEEISVTIGRLYDGLQSGRPVGEVMQRLQELGAVSGETREQIESLSKQGKDTEAWLLAEEALSRFSGSMKLQSGTWKGLLSTLSDNITQALAKFGTPIIDSLKPYLQGTIAIVDQLSKKAADIGADIAESFIASSSAVKTFQKAIDAINSGNIKDGFYLFWETMKLQSMQTANEIYKRLVAAFQTAGDYIGAIFAPSGALFQTLISGAEFIGNKMSASIQRNLAKALAGSWLTESIALQLNKGANEANTAANKIETSLKGAGSRISEQFGKAGEALPKSFEENYAKVPPLFANLTEQQKIVKKLQDEITAAVGNTNSENAKSLVTIKDYEAEISRLKALGNEKDKEKIDLLEKELGKLKDRQALKDAIAKREAEEKEAKVAIIKLETEINKAKADGNKELVKSLESQKTELENNAEIKKLTEEYQKTIGVNANEAARLATNFVNAKTAASHINDKSITITVTTKIDDSKYRDLLAELAAGNKDPKVIETVLTVTGADDLKEGYKILKDMETLNKNYEAAIKVTGARSVEELWQQINGIPTESQKQLAMQITGEKDFDNALKKLQSFGGVTSAKVMLEGTGIKDVGELERLLKGVGVPRYAKVIAETLGLKDVETARTALDRVIQNDGKKTTVTVNADTATAQQSIADLGQPTTTSVSADTTQAQQSIADLSQPVDTTLNADASIEDIKKDFKAGIDTAINGSEGSKILETIRTYVETIKDLVTKIEPKLPTHALA